ncbi:hypothetical protein MPTK1_6g10400 [Marchantia polymorpha subsp. ruderalis]|uniref:Uncharacterized protein n=2 Tax=Marchantia polymorpha TaxID=3197 RepID=A0AAF6BQK2_MARPO|nr:hypothetical protein MARPO_0016s0082 [Marchantia polymorpha]BBN14286.1 hypothetical protein Mp_6g10400 [Marchantia polymorpha subsp. ruderalis]|eukprot:PTQ45021.1 hypothetical protein MARPO_0016s0082 [Marchantia polymorpha]
MPEFLVPSARKPDHTPSKLLRKPETTYGDRYWQNRSRQQHNSLHSLRDGSSDNFSSSPRMFRTIQELGGK